jgi:hypothetical protein
MGRVLGWGAWQQRPSTRELAWAWACTKNASLANDSSCALRTEKTVGEVGAASRNGQLVTTCGWQVRVPYKKAS